jgi:hypothetical protein
MQWGKRKKAGKFADYEATEVLSGVADGLSGQEYEQLFALLINTVPGTPTKCNTLAKNMFKNRHF